MRQTDTPTEPGKTPGSCCGSERPGLVIVSAPKPPASAAKAAWVAGSIRTVAGHVPVITTELSASEFREHFRCRISGFRERYSVPPGLYAVGSPDAGSDVLVSANYKLSFDTLRKELSGLSVWILVLDTKGINVWCAAGKETFGTAELAGRIEAVQLGKVVSHRKILLPQLGAPGVSAHTVRELTGFRVIYGPVYAKDIPAFIKAGYRATEEMRTIKFSLADRVVLTPMEINPAMKKYYPLFAVAILVLFGLQPTGLLFRDALKDGLPFLLLGLVSVFSGAFVTPALLPFVPGRSFAVKGWLTGAVTVAASVPLIFPEQPGRSILISAAYLFFPLASSYIALQFTGSTTFTGMSGVKKELKYAIPVYLISSAVSIGLLLWYKFGKWGLL